MYISNISNRQTTVTVSLITCGGCGGAQVTSSTDPNLSFVYTVLLRHCFEFYGITTTKINFFSDLYLFINVLIFLTETNICNLNSTLELSRNEVKSS